MKPCVLYNVFCVSCLRCFFLSLSFHLPVATVSSRKTVGATGSTQERDHDWHLIRKEQGSSQLHHDVAEERTSRTGTSAFKHSAGSTPNSNHAAKGVNTSSAHATTTRASREKRTELQLSPFGSKPKQTQNNKKTLVVTTVETEEEARALVDKVRRKIFTKNIPVGQDYNTAGAVLHDPGTISPTSCVTATLQRIKSFYRWKSAVKKNEPEIRVTWELTTASTGVKEPQLCRDLFLGESDNEGSTPMNENDPALQSLAVKNNRTTAATSAAPTIFPVGERDEQSTKATTAKNDKILADRDRLATLIAELHPYDTPMILTDAAVQDDAISAGKKSERAVSQITVRSANGRNFSDLAADLVAKRLAACVQIVVDAADKNEDKETASAPVSKMLIKTKASLVARVLEEIQAEEKENRNHSGHVDQDSVLVEEMRANQAYAEWVQVEVSDNG
ncbi:unnamed protein product [Amoebophrya sp. A120]|nr:unnamed protein product [Amoebophrya sp. A120]|eukprot:GSA120T00010180001.1